MSYVDFDRSVTNSSGEINGGADGSPALNNLLTNPIDESEHGQWCRRWGFVSTTRSSASYHLIGASVSGGQFVDIPATKSLTLRRLCRIEEPTGANSARSLMAEMVAKAPGPFAGGPFSSPFPTPGYFFAFGEYTFTPGNADGNYNQGVIRPYIHTKRPDMMFDGVIVKSQVGTGSYNYNTWYNLRMDVIPIGVNGSLGDLIKAYVSNIDPDVDIDPPDSDWTEIASVFVDVADIDYRAWATPGDRCGFAQGGQDGGGGNVKYLYVDRARAKTVSV